MHRKILIMGLPGAGKTTLAQALTPRLSAVYFNADEVRKHVNRDLGFAAADRIEQARRMGWLCDQVVKAGGIAIADFICPTPQARAAFLEGGEAFIVWVDRIKKGVFEDTNKMFLPPERHDLRITPDGAPEYWCERVAERVRPVFNAGRPTALFIGRYQPFHDGHKAHILKGLNRVGQVCIAVRDTQAGEDGSALPFGEVRARIEQSLRQYQGQFEVIQLPNISHVFYGREVDFLVERIELDGVTDTISATDQRKRSVSHARKAAKGG
jgi:adenylylsulfate kinase